MARFIQEVQRRSAIQHHLQDNGCPTVSFIDEKTAPMRSATEKLGCENEGSELVFTKQAQPITPQMEKDLWDKKIFGRETGEAQNKCLDFEQPTSTDHYKSDSSAFAVMKTENIYNSWVGRVRIGMEAYINERWSPKT